jgi:hypothetical protein
MYTLPLLCLAGPPDEPEVKLSTGQLEARHAVKKHWSLVAKPLRDFAGRQETREEINVDFQTKLPEGHD